MKNIYVKEHERNNDAAKKKKIVKEKVLEGKLTGFASVDKPWLKFYDEEAINGVIPQKKIYDYMKAFISNNLDYYSYEFFGNKITNKELLKNIDKVTKSLVYQKVKKGDIVSLISPTTPEAIYVLYALNRIGAVCNIIDPRLSVDNLKEKTSYSNVIISIDLASPKVDELMNNDNKIIYYSISESFPKYLKVIYNFKNKNKNKKHGSGAIVWKDFLKAGDNVEKVNDSKYEKDAVAIIVSTSGTSGKSKLAQLSNENVNAVAWQYAHSGIAHKLGDTFLNIMPIFLSYGVVAGIHMPLTLGFKNVIIPQRDLKKMGSYLLKYKPQAYLDIPGGFDSLMNDPKIHSIRKKHIKINGKTYNITFEKSRDLSFLNNPGVGGDHLNEQLEVKTNEFLKAHNNKNKVQKGYGMTEVSSAAIVNVDENCNSINSVGVPFPKTNVKVVNPDTTEELKYNEIGELLISSPAIFKGYLDNSNATNSEIIEDDNGIKWIKTGDLFTINENGELFFKERMKTMFVRPDGHNNHPNIMNELILKHPYVFDACTVGVDSPNHSYGKFPKAVVVLKKEYRGMENEIQKQLEKMCMDNFSQRDVPYFYEFKDSLPMTQNGKVDYRLLENEGIDNCRYAEIYIKEYGSQKVLSKKKI